jgi:hypothetical protein
MERIYLMDTEERAQAEMLRWLRGFTPAQLLKMVVQAIDVGRQIHEAALKQRCPWDL